MTMGTRPGVRLLIRIPYRLAGVVVFSLGNCLNFVSFGFAAQVGAISVQLSPVTIHTSNCLKWHPVSLAMILRSL